jgi:predicted methyltransferase
MRRALALALAFALAGCAHAPGDRLAQLAASPHRTPANVARDPHRHPLEVIEFLGIRETSTVVEILPGSGGYYLEILAPYLKDKGRYIAASRDPSALPRYWADHLKLLARLESQPELYGKVVVTQFNAGLHEIAPPASADFVLVFRSLHNWVERGEAEGALRVIHRALKPGGIFGIVGHRGRTDRPQEAQARTGYLREDYAIALIERAGFRLVGKSEVNANPRDTRDHPEGVWTLPPTYRLRDVDREKYRAIGESDRFTLKFAKR